MALVQGSVPDVLKDAAAEIGTTESPAGSNRTKYGRAYGMDGYAWCAMFTWWLLAFKNKLELIKSAYTPTIADWFRQAGRFFTDVDEAEIGDLIFFHNGSRICHIGIVEKRLGPAQFQTIEGNTSAGSSGSQDNGGGVYRRTRMTVPGFAIAGFGRPSYKPAPKKPVYDFPKKDWMGLGDKGADVRNWQRDLNQYFKAKGFLKPLVVDGDFEWKTVRATKQFQSDQGLDVDARVGQHTIRRMEKVRDRQREKEKP